MGLEVEEPRRLRTAPRDMPTGGRTSAKAPCNIVMTIATITTIIVVYYYYYYYYNPLEKQVGFCNACLR